MYGVVVAYIRNNYCMYLFFIYMHGSQSKLDVLPSSVFPLKGSSSGAGLFIALVPSLKRTFVGHSNLIESA